MNSEENKRRSSDENVNYIKKNICNKDGDKSYVFISYKSDDWETVLHDCVYRLVKDYGLNVYFDGNFDSHNSLWIKQFPENMNDYKCNGVIAFFDDKYATSYATLMELMYSQTAKATKSKSYTKGLPIVPIDLSKLTNITGKEAQRNTGLGISTYEDGTKNVNAGSEMDLFTKAFEELVERGILRNSKYIWNRDEKNLDATTCSRIVEELRAYKKINDNPYTWGMKLDGIVESIKDACGEEVFSNVGTKVTTSHSSGEDVAYCGKLKNKCEPDSRVQDQNVGNSNPETGKKKEYVFTLWGTNYTSKNLASMMHDAFDLIAKKYPEKIQELADSGAVSSVARKDDVDGNKLPPKKYSYFRAKKEHNVGGAAYYVGTSYGREDAIKQIEKMLVVCEGSKDAFKVMSSPEKKSHDSSKTGKKA